MLTIILTLGCFAPVPVMITGRFEQAKSSTAALIAPSWGPGRNKSGDAIDPHAISLG